MGDLIVLTEEVTKSWEHYEEERRNLLQDNIPLELVTSDSKKIIIEYNSDTKKLIVKSGKNTLKSTLIN